MVNEHVWRARENNIVYGYDSLFTRYFHGTPRPQYHNRLHWKMPRMKKGSHIQKKRSKRLRRRKEKEEDWETAYDSQSLQPHALVDSSMYESNTCGVDYGEDENNPGKTETNLMLMEGHFGNGQGQKGVNDVTVKVENEMSLLDGLTDELDVDGRNEQLTAAEDGQGQIPHRADEGCPENFVVDCDPMIVTNPGLSVDVTRPLSSDDNSSYSSSSNPLFTDILKNNELFYKQMASVPNTLNDAELAKALQEHYDKLEAMNEEMYEKRKKAAAIQRRRRKRMLEKMTEEELKQYRAAQTEACRQRRVRRLERMSDEERQRDRMLKNALCLARRHRREAMMSEEERKARRAAAAAAQREKRKRKRESMTVDELKAHKAEVAAVWRMRRHLRYMRMSEEERQAERAKAAEAKRISRQRQKDKDDPEEIVKPTTQRRPRRKRTRSQLSFSESESDAIETNSYSMESNAESLISQILKQTQHIAAMESQQGDLVPPDSLENLPKDPPFNEETYLLPHEIPEKETVVGSPKVTNETYLLPHEIPDKEPEAGQHHEDVQETNQKTYMLPHEMSEQQHPVMRNCSNIGQVEKQENYILSPELQEPHQTSSPISKIAQETKQETYILSQELPEKQNDINHYPKVEQEIKQESSYLLPQEMSDQHNPIHHRNVTQNMRDDRHSEISDEYLHASVQDVCQPDKIQQLHHRDISNDVHPGAPHLYHQHNIENSSHHLQHRIHESEQMRAAQLYHHGNMPYDSRAALHPYHINNIHGIDHLGRLQQYHHHGDNQDNQTGALPYIHGRNYMNTLY
ncbi:uncharacterized abhydrolase domain-containing protein DDB_G0269086-like isoform X2 [Palaemon carinicauda]|uniref:uncharacterized abhydrolase domain-containing protein DDB_G0269086-like isoform X2 n=1 Tax=Palaemon carinicauda TaxID=392227 RepID=UPI0035B59EFD